MNNKRQRNKLIAMLMLVILVPCIAWAQSHSYINGFCTDEDCSDKYEPAAERNGWYEISNVGQLYWFAEQVNNGSTDLINANVRLINDIFDNDVTFSYDAENDYAPIATDASGKNVDVNTLRVWNPIGIQTGWSEDTGGGKLADEKYPDKQKWFGGHFDGQGFYISGLYFNDATIFGGLFAMLRYTCNIENVKIDNCYFRGQIVGSIAACLEGGTVNNCHNSSFLYGSIMAGGIVAQTRSRFSEETLYGEVNIRNCSNKGLVYSWDYAAGGIVAVGYDTHTQGKLSCLLNVGQVVSGQDVSGEIIGEIRNGNYQLKSCYGQSGNNSLIGNGSDSAEIINSQGLPIEDFRSGKVAYLLNDCKSDGTQAWYQKLGEDDLPVLHSTGDNTVYGAYQHGGQEGRFSNEAFANQHSKAYNAEAEDEANGNHDVSYEGKYTWTESENKAEKPSVAATYICKVCEKTVTPEQMTVDVDADNTKVEATCTEAGREYYKTIYTFNTNAVFSDIYAQPLPALGHDMSEAVTFNDDKKIYQKGCTRDCGYHDYYATSDGSVPATPNDDATTFTVEEFTLDDATAYDNKARFTVKELTYRRTFKNSGWQALYVPFDLYSGQIFDDYELATINNFHEYEQVDGSTNVELEVKKVVVSNVIPALTPCLIRKKQVSDVEPDSPDNLGFADVAFAPAADKSIDCASVSRYYQFVGTLEEKSGFVEGTDFCMLKGELWPAGSSSRLSAQRWYLRTTDRTGGLLAPTTPLSRIAIRVIGEGSATGIEDIRVVTDSGTADAGKQGIYDLQGRKLDKEPESGIYIKNGKKCVK